MTPSFKIVSFKDYINNYLYYVIKLLTKVIMRSFIPFILSLLFVLSSCSSKKEVVNKIYSGNPILEGWYADPEGIIFDNEYWIYPTYAREYNEPDTFTTFTDEQLKIRENTISEGYLFQTFLDAFSSKDLITWTKHPQVLSINDISWAGYSLWAPAIIKANDKYHLFFSANDIQNNDELGGIGVSVADNPAGPFKDALGKPLIDKIVNGAQPIDQFVFKDDDGQFYMYYGGWQHLNIVKLADDLLSLETFDDGTTYKEITPENYVEGPFLLKRKGLYYLMWSEGGWGGPNYSVAYGISDSPLGPFDRIEKILQQDPQVATGAGHHSVISIPGTDEHYIVYHRRPLGRNAAEERVVAIEKMEFDKDGKILPVKITFEGVERRPLK